MATVLGSTPSIVAASLVAYIVSWFIDVEVSAAWEERIGRFKWARVLAGQCLINIGRTVRGLPIISSSAIVPGDPSES